MPHAAARYKEQQDQLAQVVDWPLPPDSLRAVAHAVQRRVLTPVTIRHNVSEDFSCRHVMRISSVSLLFLLLLLASCAFLQPQEFKGPTGKTAYSMRCNQMGYSVDTCYKKAGEPCSNGYTTIGPASGVGVPVRGGIMTAPQHNVAIECK